jgi:predicted glycosyltransferase
LIVSDKAPEAFRDRLAFIKKVIDKFRPNVFMTEDFPFAREFWSFEVPYIIKYLKNGFACRIVGSSGYLGWIDNMHEYIKELYDLLLIHSPWELSQNYQDYFSKRAVGDLRRVLSDYAHKIHFTGFIMDRIPLGNVKKIKAKYLDSKHKYLILVSRGGGVFSKKLILCSLLLAQKNKDLFFIISCGPATPEEEFNEYKIFAKNIKNIELYKFIPPSCFETYLRAADASINLAGYNTLARLLYYQKKTVLIPYDTQEQRWRADSVAKFLVSRVIKEKDLNTHLLEKALRELLKDSRKAHQFDRRLLCGISNTGKILASFFKKNDIL